MDRLIDLLADNDTVAGRLVTSGDIVVAAYLVAVVLGWVTRARSRSTFGRYYATSTSSCSSGGPLCRAS